MAYLMKTRFTKVTFEINRKLQKEDSDFFSPTQGKKNKMVAISFMQQTYFELHNGITTRLELLSVYHIHDAY